MRPRDVRRVELRAGPGGGGDPLDVTEVHWPWLLGPQGFEFEEVGQSTVRIWPASTTAGLATRNFEGDRIPDSYFGSIPFVARRAGDSALSLIHLTYPPPAPFDAEGAQRMWDTLCAHGFGLPESVRAQGRLAGAGVPTDLGHHVDYVLWEEVQRAASDLLGSWPKKLHLKRTVRPIHRYGGVVDHAGTAAMVGITVPIVEVNGANVPASTARTVIDYDAWRFAGVGLVTEQLAGALLQMAERTGGELTPAGMHRFLEIARICRSARGRIDPPMSSWPRKVRRYYVVALAMLTELRAALAGGLPAPLCDFWRLYEEWVTVTVFRALRGELGDPDTGPHLDVQDPDRINGAWRAAWHLKDGSVVHFIAKPRFDGSARRLIPQEAARYRSVSSVLIPDALIVIGRPNGIVLHVVDAKKRTAATGIMAASDSAAEASKYLWGIRRVGAEMVPDGVNQVTLLSSLSGVRMNDPALAKIKVSRLLPSPDGLNSLMGELIPHA